MTEKPYDREKDPFATDGRHPAEEFDANLGRWVKRRNAGAGRPRKDAAHHEMMGNFRPSRHGEREIGGKHKSTTLKAYRAPSPPKALHKDSKKVWRALCKELKTKRLPKSRDVVIFEALCVAIKEMRRLQGMLEEDKYLAPSIERSRLLAEKRSAIEVIHKFAPKFGLDPLSSRDISLKDSGAARVAAEAAEAAANGSGTTKTGNSDDEGGPDILSFVAS